MITKQNHEIDLQKREYSKKEGRVHQLSDLLVVCAVCHFCMVSGDKQEHRKKTC